MRTLILGAFLGLSLLAPAQRSLSIRGQVHFPEVGSASCSVTLLTECGDTLAVDHLPSGRHFHYCVHRNASYLLRFEHGGSVTKEMVVDASELPQVRRVYAVRRIEFDVIMEPGDPGKLLRYTEPVGFGSFDRGSTMRVYYDPAAEAVVNTW